MQFIPDLECLDKVQIMKRERPFQINTLDSIRFRIALVLFVVTILAITSVVIFSIGDVKTMDQELPGTGTELSVSYLEDPAGQLTLEEILQTEETHPILTVTGSSGVPVQIFALGIADPPGGLESGPMK